MRGSNGAKIGIAVTLLAVAAVILLFTSGEETQPDAQVDDVRQLEFVCTACEHQFTMPHADVLKIRVKPPPREGGPPRLRIGDNRPDRVPCQKCSDPVAVESQTCNQHGKHYPKRSLEGEAGYCPDCG